MEKFKGKYRIESARMPGWDYASGGKYFVTICTNNKVCCFGEVVHGHMQLNEMGEIVRKYWMDISGCFTNTFLDTFQIMPNHVHGIIVMKRAGRNDCSVSGGDCDGGGFAVRSDETRSRRYVPPSVSGNVPPPVSGNVPENLPNDIPENISKTTSLTVPATISPNQQMAKISPKPGSLSVIVGGWKSKCTKEFNKLGYPWHGWQSRFHDRIIRNDGELQRIQQYIRNNPANWNG